MKYDLIIKNGFIINGLNTPGYIGDIGVKDGVISKIGTLQDQASKIIEADGHVVAPGFVDIHTHYDAQICWDPALTSSSEHGVTTVVLGNCGIGVAPSLPEHREINALDLVSLEGMSIDVLKEGVTWEWDSFESFMDYAEKQQPGINLSFLVPLATLRRYVMGDEASRRPANKTETEKISDLLKRAIASGANGFSTSAVERQKGWQGQPLACTLASLDELRSYSRVLKKFKRGVIQTNCANKLGVLSDEEFAFLDMLMVESGQPVSWSGGVSNGDGMKALNEYLKKIEPLVAKGGKPQGTSRPLTVEVGLKNPFFMTDLEVGQKVLGQTFDVQMKHYNDKTFRRDVLFEWNNGGKLFSSGWMDCQILRVKNDNMRQYLRRTVAEIAEERGEAAIDTFFSLPIEDNLNLKYLGGVGNSDEGLVQQIIVDDRILIGMGDGGAHVDMLLESGYPTYLLGHWVREKNAMTIEHAIHRITSEPAKLFGIKDRGQLTEGMAADITIFDKNKINSSKKATEVKHDLPAGGERLYIKANGINYVLVNGSVLFDHGALTDQRAGKILR